MSIGRRLSEVRKAKKLSQEAFGALGRVGRKSQALFEADKNVPNAGYFVELHRSGIDIGYVLTGTATSMDPVEHELMRRFREASDEMRAAALRVLEAFAAPVPARAAAKSPGMKISGGSQGQVVNAREVRQRGVRLNIGTQKK